MWRREHSYSRPRLRSCTSSKDPCHPDLPPSQRPLAQTSTHDIQEAATSRYVLPFDYRFITLRGGSAPAPESPYATPPPRREYAPPPGPPPGWDRAFGVSPPEPNHRQQATEQRRPGGAAPTGALPERRQRILSHDEEVQRLFKVCSTAKGNAQLLRETIAYTKPEDLKHNELIEVRLAQDGLFVKLTRCYHYLGVPQEVPPGSEVDHFHNSLGDSGGRALSWKGY